MQNIRIGLFGYGVVGAGFDKLVSSLEGVSIDKIAVRHPFLHKELKAPRLADNKYDILHDENIDLIIEAIDDAEAAFDILKLALQHKKPVITANKKMIASHLPEIIRLQKRFNTPVLYEAACCAGVPVIRNIEEYYNRETTRKFSGIINGSTNYILTAMERYRFRFNHALQLAQEAGFAESDAALDVEGKDAAYKLSIILKHLWGMYVSPENLVHTGIQNILPQDLKFAEQLNGVIKLVASTERVSDGAVSAFILPKLVLKQDVLYNVTHEYNGVVITDNNGDEQLLYGKGSGADPTALGLWNDVRAWKRGYHYRYTEEGAIGLNYEQEIAVHISITGNVILPADLTLYEYARDNKYIYVTGSLSLDKLRQDEWWKQEGVSLLDISDIEADSQEDLIDKLQTIIALQRDIFQPV